MLKGILRFAETGVLVSAIFGIYGFTFLTVFSLNPKTENVTANEVSQSQVLGTDSEVITEIGIENISEDTFDFRTSLEKTSEKSFIYTLSFLDNVEILGKDILSLTNLGTETSLVNYEVSSSNLDESNLRLFFGGEELEMESANNVYTINHSLLAQGNLSLDLSPNGEGETWYTIKINIEF